MYEVFVLFCMLLLVACPPVGIAVLVIVAVMGVGKLDGH